MRPTFHPEIIELADGKRGSREIAEIVGLSPRYVRRLMARYGCPQPTTGAQPGERNVAWRGGRSVDRDGYVTVPVPEGHPNPRTTKRILEHRMVMERQSGSPLPRTAVVDHIDGLTLHNAPDNLRTFDSNGEHLASTISGTPRRWTPGGRKNIGQRTDLGAKIVPVDIYRQRRASGDVRLRQILLAALKLGIDSPYLSGTRRHLERARIDPDSRPSLERALRDLYQRWGWDPPRFE